MPRQEISRCESESRGLCFIFAAHRTVSFEFRSARCYNESRMINHSRRTRP